MNKIIKSMIIIMLLFLTGCYVQPRTGYGVNTRNGGYNNNGYYNKNNNNNGYQNQSFGFPGNRPSHHDREVRDHRYNNGYDHRYNNGYEQYHQDGYRSDRRRYR